MDTYIILTSDSSLRVNAVGTKTGRTFQSERSAEQAARTLRTEHPHLDVTVLLLNLFPV